MIQLSYLSPKTEAREELRRWIGWKARPLLRIRYGSEDDAGKPPKAQISDGQAAYQRVEDNAFHLGYFAR